MTIADARPCRGPGAAARWAGIVLIVDDDPLVGEMIHHALSRSGLDAIVAGSPAEALALADRYPITLLVTDFLMPGMTGVELAGRIRDRHAAIPVILVSGSPEAADLTIGSPSSFLAKPFSPGELARAVASYTALPSAAP